MQLRPVESCRGGVGFARRKSSIPSSVPDRVQRLSYEQVLISSDQVTGRQIFLEVGRKLISLNFHEIRIDGLAVE